MESVKQNSGVVKWIAAGAFAALLVAGGLLVQRVSQLEAALDGQRDNFRQFVGMQFANRGLEAGVRLACHPQDPGFPKGEGWRGVETVLGSPDGLRRFVETSASPNHGLNFCQGTISEMLRNPNEEIHDIIRHFAREGKIFNVHFRNIRGRFLKFEETFPDDGDIDMPRALRAYRDVGYDGMVMPDHVPQIVGDPGGHKGFAFCFGYIQALMQVLRAET